jgi:peptidyl-prolyl cis-trans isomerase B (cyclophilin B)
VARFIGLPIAAACAGLVLAGCGGGSTNASKTATHSAPLPRCRAASRPLARPIPELHPPRTPLDPTRRWVAVVETNCGRFSFVLDVRDSPRTTASFVWLVRQRYFDQTIFHRVVPGFVIQGGDPTQSGQSGPGYETVDVPPKHTRYVRGTVAMAKRYSDPAGTAGSQFFIVTGRHVRLPSVYAVLGHVSSGLPVVNAIGRLGSRITELPSATIVIARIRIVVR